MAKRDLTALINTLQSLLCVYYLHLNFKWTSWTSIIFFTVAQLIKLKSRVKNTQVYFPASLCLVYFLFQFFFQVYWCSLFCSNFSTESCKFMQCIFFFTLYQVTTKFFVTIFNIVQVEKILETKFYVPFLLLRIKLIISYVSCINNRINFYLLSCFL